MVDDLEEFDDGPALERMSSVMMREGSGSASGLGFGLDRISSVGGFSEYEDERKEEMEEEEEIDVVGSVVGGWSLRKEVLGASKEVVMDPGGGRRGETKERMITQACTRCFILLA